MLSKEETVEEIKRVYPTLKKFIDNYRKIQDIKSSIKDTKYVPSFKELSITKISGYDFYNGFLKGTFFIAPIVFGFILASNFAVSAGSAAFSFFIGIIAGTAGPLLLDLQLAKVAAESYNAKVKIHNKNVKREEFPIAENLTDQNIDLFSKISISKIPSDYLHPAILDLFLKYLNTYRADNLKECIIIYEEESKHNETLNRLQNVEKALFSEMREISREVAATRDTILNEGSRIRGN